MFKIKELRSAQWEMEEIMLGVKYIVIGSEQHESRQRENKSRISTSISIDKKNKMKYYVMLFA